MSKKLMLIVSLVLLTGLVLFLVGCPGGTATDEGSEAVKNAESAEKNDSPIARVDFKNFAFPVKSSDDKEKTIALKDGKLEKTKEAGGATLGEIQYADLTGDKQDEAIINLSVEGDKDAKSNMVYVYTLENEKPKLLWNFETPGGENVGLKAISFEKGNLLVEIFGEAKFVKGVWEMGESKEKGKYTKTELKWNGKEFSVEGKPEVLEIESKT